MAVVLDANLPIVLATDDAWAPRVSALVEQWLSRGEDLHAPSLLPYEFASGLTRLVVAGRLPVEEIAAAWHVLGSLPIIYHPLDEKGEAVVRIARQLGRVSAYDAAYLALARDLDAALWTFDGPLARNARAFGFPIHLVD